VLRAQGPASSSVLLQREGGSLSLLWAKDKDCGDFCAAVKKFHAFLTGIPVYSSFLRDEQSRLNNDSCCLFLRAPALTQFSDHHHRWPWKELA